MLSYWFSYCFCCLACFGLSTPLRSADADTVTSDSWMQDDEIHFGVSGYYLPTLGEAKTSALEKAQERLGEILRARGIQRFILPPLDWIDQELVLKKYQKTSRTTIDDKEWLQLTIQLRLTPQHVRSFRKMERTSLSAMAVGLLAVVFLASWLYYRLDEWSKGYLTSWLAIALVVAGTIVGGVWWWLHS